MTDAKISEYTANISDEEMAASNLQDKISQQKISLDTASGKGCG